MVRPAYTSVFAARELCTVRLKNISKHVMKRADNDGLLLVQACDHLIMPLQPSFSKTPEKKLTPRRESNSSNTRMSIANSQLIADLKIARNSAEEMLVNCRNGTTN